MIYLKAYMPLATLNHYKRINLYAHFTFLNKHARPSARPPIDMSGNLTANVPAKSISNISPNPYEHISKFSEPNDNY